MRRIATIFSLCLFVTAGSAQTPATAPPQQTAAPTVTQAAAVLSADQLLQQGRANYKAGRYSEAAQDLRAASAAFLSPEEKQRYIETGKLETLPQVEQSLVYLALAYARLGKDPEARDAIMRLANAERIAPTFASLPLDPETSDFPALVARIAPGIALPENAQLARGGATTTQPTAVAAAQPATTSSPASVTPAPTASPATPVPSAAIAQVQPSAAPTAAAAADRATMLRQMEEQVAQARAQIDREAAARIAEAQRQADARVAAEKVAVDKAAQEKIATERVAAEKAAAERIAAERAAIERDTAAKIAAERAAAEKTVQQQTAAEKPVERAVEAKTAQQPTAVAKPVERSAEEQTRFRVMPADSEQQRTWLTNLRQAQSLAESGSSGDANAIYVAIANAPNAPREIIAAAASGLYRTSDFRDAAAGFSRLGSFARGEEDLRYYYAVSLFEIGRFGEAKRELACSLPFIEVTGDVLRYQAKIEQMPSSPGK